MKALTIIFGAVLILVLVWAIRIMLYNFRLRRGLRRISKMLQGELPNQTEEKDIKEFKAMIKLADELASKIKITKPIEWEDE